MSPTPPPDLSQLQAQLDAASRAVLLVAQPAREVLAVTGNDAQSWLNGLLTNDVAKLAVGLASYGLAVSQKGRILADLLVLREPERVLLVIPSSSSAALRAHFEKYLIMEDAEVGETGLAVHMAHGPRSAELLDRAKAKGGHGALRDTTGLGGAVVLTELPLDLSSDVAALGGAVGDLAGWEALRLERGIPAFGADFDASTYPQEAGLEKRAVSFDKGCYLGQEVVCMLEMRGHVKRKLVPVLFEPGAKPSVGASVADSSGAEVGKLTSVVQHPSWNQAVGLAMVKLAQAGVDTTLRVGDASARVFAPA